MSGFLDRMPAALRHAIIGLAAAVLAYATANYTSWGLNEAAYPIIGALLTVLVLWITPASQQYGVGSASVDVPVDPEIVEAEVDH